MWYVIQVRTGNEEEIKLQCKKLIEPEILEKCFIPYYEQMKRYHGKWHKERRILFPGYVFLVSDAKDKLPFALKRVMGLTKLIKADGEILPLTEAEVDFLLDFGKEEQVVGMSKGIIVNDKVIIQTGPLKGNEGLIKKIDRHKRKAWLKLNLLGRTVETQVGLEIVEKKETKKKVEKGKDEAPGENPGDGEDQSETAE